MRPKAGRRRTEDGGQRTEDRGQRTEDGGQRTEDGGQRTEDRGQRTEDRGRRSDGNSRTQTGPKKAKRKAQGAERMSRFVAFCRVLACLSCLFGARREKFGRRQTFDANCANFHGIVFFTVFFTRAGSFSLPDRGKFVVSG